VLRTSAALFRQILPGVELIARYGGEEFAITFPKTSAAACEHLRLWVETHDWSFIHPHLKVTVSIGVRSDPSLPNHEKLLAAANEQLYAAKRAGRNWVFPQSLWSADRR